MDLAGDPFYLSPLTTIHWTLPQVLFAWVRRQQDQSWNARQSIFERMVSIGGVLSEDGNKQAKRIMTDLEGLPVTDRELIEQMGDAAQMIMFGSKRGGHQGNTDKD